MRIRLLNFFKKVFSLHQHNWQLVSKTISEPRNLPSPFPPNLSKAFLDKAIFGFTTYIWECEGCGEIKIKECLGVEITTLEDVLDRVDIYGNQPIVKGEKEYVVILKPSNSQPNVLNKIPIRRINEN